MRSGRQQIVASGDVEEFDCPERVREELSRVLHSDHFHATPKRRAMLTFLIEEALAGRADTLKGYVIGLAVFCRDENFDPQSDPIVRLEARRLRHDLDSYYIAEGARNPIRISIPKGQYAPKFHDNLASVTARDGSTTGNDETADSHVPEEVNASPRPARTSPRLPWLVALGAVLFALLVLGAAFVMYLVPPKQERLETSKPSVMVLPFSVTSANPEQQILAAGIAEQIMTALSRFPDFRIFWPPVGTKTAETFDPVEIGRQENVSFLITGSVGSEDGIVRVSAKLVHSPSKRVLWSGSYDRMRSRTTLLEIEKSIASEIATVAGQPYGVIKSELAGNLSVGSEPSNDSFECVLRGYVYRRNFSRQLHATVEACLNSAVKRDPGYVEAWAMLGWIYLDAGRFGLAADGNKELAFDRALDAASHALSLDGNNILALKALSSINHYMGNIEEGERLAKKALELDPNDPDTLAQLGWRLSVVGKFEEGIPYLEKAIERTRNAPGWYFHLIAINHLLNGHYAEMLTAAKKGVLDGSGVSWCLVAVAQSKLGNKEAARAALEKMADVSPGLSRDPGAFLRSHRASEQIVTSLMAGLREAGWTAPAGQ
ncbi:tetratricopeptide repeat protein [Labrenzia sp. R5_0]|jgi:TolB-like protein|uniref:tetratricopeptide repeat protein n=1 Tax=Labrenzia sp. R5_0 TaxID=2821108 RepID=UPI001ADBE779|nr:tetratricopeptide repeat protein [Labrenzia sp. R5_0]MBO9457596.1 tetratricopeptide repeat protein [Labrenzia sp. R5_0]